MDRNLVITDDKGDTIPDEVLNYNEKPNRIFTDWINQEQVKAEIRVAVRNIPRKADIPLEEIDKIVPVIMEQAENNYVQLSLLST